MRSTSGSPGFEKSSGNSTFIPLINPRTLHTAGATECSGDCRLYSFCLTQERDGEWVFLPWRVPGRNKPKVPVSSLPDHSFFFQALWNNVVVNNQSVPHTHWGRKSIIMMRGTDKIRGQSRDSSVVDTFLAYVRPWVSSPPPWRRRKRRFLVENLVRNGIFIFCKWSQGGWLLPHDLWSHFMEVTLLFHLEIIWTVWCWLDGNQYNYTKMYIQLTQIFSLFIPLRSFQMITEPS